jgi:hypothetical protein
MNKVTGNYTATGMSLVTQKIKRHGQSLTIFRILKLRRENFYFLHFRAYGSI